MGEGGRLIAETQRVELNRRCVQKPFWTVFSRPDTDNTTQPAPGARA